MENIFARVSLISFISGLEKYDLPKGKLDQDESTIEAAIRETREESNITQLDFKWGTGTLVLDCLTIYVAATNQECQIQKNPITGSWEHHGYKWMAWEEIEQKLYDYLKPAIPWAKGIVEGC